ncbi:MAG: VOC family protein [Deltaproteobacteria bacterium]|nr:MAG: VOC family protein [Deltaproteobacteria bacterium]
MKGLVLFVKDPETLAQFYCDVLGMHREASGDSIVVGYGGIGAKLHLCRTVESQPYEHHRLDRYWKFAIHISNLDLAVEQLVAKGISVSEPQQFRDIAYLCHMTDPEGHVIELIQHTFEGEQRTSEGDPELPLGGDAHLGLVTLRTDNMEVEFARCVDELGMSYLSRQALTDLGFDLYFFAFTDEQPPNEDLNSVENRPWLWQRPYTVLEFQHRLTGESIQQKPEDSVGAATVLLGHPGGRVEVLR